MIQITPIPPEEWIVIFERKGAGRNRAMRPDQKSLAWMKDMLSKFSKLGHVVPDLCARMYAAGEACMILH